MRAMTIGPLGAGLALILAGCAAVAMADNVPPVGPQKAPLQMRLPKMETQPLTRDETANLRNILSEDARPRERAGLPDCGLIERPLTILPNLGGDTVRVGTEGVFYIYDEGDQSEGPDLSRHDKLILPGTPDEAEILIGENSVSFCYVDRRLAVTVFRQLCEGQGWNNTFESITFDAGATFVSPSVLGQLEPGESYLSPERLESLNVD